MTALDVIAELAGVPPVVIRELNPHYLRMVTPPRTASVVRLPAGTMAKVTDAYSSLPATSRVAFREHVVTKGAHRVRLASLSTSVPAHGPVH